MALPTKCVFMKKPLETLMLAQSKRSLFVDYTLKCPVMTHVLTKNDKKSTLGTCPFSSGSVMQMLSKVVNKAIHTAAKQSAEHSAEKANQNEEKRSDDNEKKPFNYDSFFENMIQKKKDDHSYRVFRKVNRKAQSFPMAEDFSFSNIPRDIAVWCSNDYLGMSRHPSVVDAAKSIIEENGVGAGGTRNISGTSYYHGLLEETLAQWHEKEAGLLFTSCFVANDTALYTLGSKLPGCVIFSDAGNHASMIHGVRTSGAKKVVFRHNDPQHLEEVLMKADSNVPKIVAFETVHSMSGAVCPLEVLCDIAHKYGALTFIDEVHAVGLYGRHGAGIGERDNCLHKMDIISGTLGKAVGCVGGYLVGSASLIDTLRSYGSGFIFTTALPPDKAYAAVTSINILRGEEGQALRKQHQANVKQLRTKLVQRGFPVEYAPSHIVPILTAGNAEKCTSVSHHLQNEHGIYIQSINYPTVAVGDEKLRVAPTPFHTEEMMDRLVEGLDEAWKKFRLPYVQPVCTSKCKCQFACEAFKQQHAVQV